MSAAGTAKKIDAEARRAANSRIYRALSRSAGAPPSPRLATGSLPPHEESSPPGTKKVKGDYLFTLDACTLDADHVTCSLTVTNRVDDRDLRISGRDSVIYDSTGYEHHPIKLTLGSEACTSPPPLVNGKKRKTGASSCEVTNRTPFDVPLALTMGFDGIPPDTTEIAFLDIAFRVDSVRFYGIPLQK